MSFSKDATDLAAAITRIVTGSGFPLWPRPFDKDKLWLERVLREAEIIVTQARKLLVQLDADTNCPAAAGSSCVGTFPIPANGICTRCERKMPPPRPLCPSCGGRMGRINSGLKCRDCGNWFAI